VNTSPAPKLAPEELLFAAFGDDDALISAVVEGHRGARHNHVGIVIEQADVKASLDQ